jgi:hypothetical protein
MLRRLLFLPSSPRSLVMGAHYTPVPAPPIQSSWPTVPQLPVRPARPSSGHGPASGLDTDRVLHVLPVLQSLLLHTPHALAGSRCAAAQTQPACGPFVAGPPSTCPPGPASEFPKGPATDGGLHLFSVDTRGTQREALFRSPAGSPGRWHAAGLSAVVPSSCVRLPRRGAVLDQRGATRCRCCLLGCCAACLSSSAWHHLFRESRSLACSVIHGCIY